MPVNVAFHSHSTALQLKAYEIVNENNQIKKTWSPGNSQPRIQLKDLPDNDLYKIAVKPLRYENGKVRKPSWSFLKKFNWSLLQVNEGIIVEVNNGSLSKRLGLDRNKIQLFAKAHNGDITELVCQRVKEIADAELKRKNLSIQPEETAKTKETQESPLQKTSSAASDGETLTLPLIILEEEKKGEITVPEAPSILKEASMVHQEPIVEPNPKQEDVEQKEVTTAQGVFNPSQKYSAIATAINGAVAMIGFGLKSFFKTPSADTVHMLEGYTHLNVVQGIREKYCPDVSFKGDLHLSLPKREELSDEKKLNPHIGRCGPWDIFHSKVDTSLLFKDRNNGDEIVCLEQLGAASCGKFPGQIISQRFKAWDDCQNYANDADRYATRCAIGILNTDNRCVPTRERPHMCNDSSLPAFTTNTTVEEMIATTTNIRRYALLGITGVATLSCLYKTYQSGIEFISKYSIFSREEKKQQLIKTAKWLGGTAVFGSLTVYLSNGLD